jgi:TRAP transporter TAXI family solute receptor
VTRRSRLLLIALLGAAALLTSACGVVRGSGIRYATGELTIATGGTKGVYYSYGVALADVISERLKGVQASAEPTSGSVQNLKLAAERPGVIAFVAGDTAADAVQGRGAFSEPLPIQAIARVYDDVIHLVVPRWSRARDISDLRGLRVSTGSPGSGTEVIANRLLQLAGLDGDSAIVRSRLGINDSIDALRAGTIDAFFWSGGLPTQGVEELADSMDIRLLPLGDLADRMRQVHGPIYRAATVPVGTYHLVDEVQAMAVPNYLVTNTGTDPGLVYHVDRLLFSHRDEMALLVPAVALLDRRTAIATSPVPLHEGALRYFRAVKR